MKGLEEVSFSPLKDEDSRELPQIPSLTATSMLLTLSSRERFLLAELTL
jgi:hypothetical protein